MNSPFSLKFPTTIDTDQFSRADASAAGGAVSLSKDAARLLMTPHTYMLHREGRIILQGYNLTKPRWTDAADELVRAGLATFDQHAGPILTKAGVELRMRLAAGMGDQLEG